MTQKNHKKALAAEQKSLIFLAALIAFYCSYFRYVLNGSSFPEIYLTLFGKLLI